MNMHATSTFPFNEQCTYVRYPARTLLPLKEVGQRYLIILYPLHCFLLLQGNRSCVFNSKNQAVTSPDDGRVYMHVSVAFHYRYDAYLVNSVMLK